MIRETFIHIAGIGRETEFHLWSSGIFDWADLRATRLAVRPEVISAIEASEAAFRQKDVDYFFFLLPAGERWRVFADFSRRFAALDIETTGLSIYDELTVVGIEMHGKYRTFIKGSNLEDAIGVLESASGLLTFNGTLFDLPFLRRTFPGIRLPSAHLDLRFLGRRVGFRGPLKEVESAAGLRRSSEVEGLGGYAATVLWSQFEHGDLNALELLIKYNSADTCVLRPMCQIIVGRLHEELNNALRGTVRQHRLFDYRRGSFLSHRADKAPRATVPKIAPQRGSLIVNGSRIQIPKRRWAGPAITIDTLLERIGDPTSRIVGIDLSGSEARPSGWALLQGDLVVSRTMRTTADILRQTIACKPDLVSIDSPLTIPEGRDCTSDKCACRQYGISRACERELRKRGIGIYWCLIQSMQALTRRGMEIASELQSAGIKVIESYPGAAQDIMRIPRKRASQDQLMAGLRSFGVRGIRAKELITHDELDAITSALVGVFYLGDMYEGLGSDSEGYLVVPLLKENAHTTDAPLLKRSVAGSSLLFLLAGAAAHEAAEQALCDLAAPRVASPVEAKRHLQRGESAVMLASEPSAYEPLLASLGPQARCILMERGGVRRLRRDALFCDLILHIEAPDWGSHLRSWLARFNDKGDKPCR